MCRKHKDSGLYSYSETFDKAFNDLGNWVMGPDFFVSSPVSSLLIASKPVQHYNPDICAREYLVRNGARGYVWDPEAQEEQARRSSDDMAMAPVPSALVTRPASVHASPSIATPYLPEDPSIAPAVGSDWPSFDWNTPEFEWMR